VVVLPEYGPGLGPVRDAPSAPRLGNLLARGPGSNGGPEEVLDRGVSLAHDADPPPVPDQAGDDARADVRLAGAWRSLDGHVRAVEAADRLGDGADVSVLAGGDRGETAIRHGAWRDAPEDVERRVLEPPGPGRADRLTERVQRSALVDGLDWAAGRQGHRHLGPARDMLRCSLLDHDNVRAVADRWWFADGCVLLCGANLPVLQLERRRDGSFVQGVEPHPRPENRALTEPADETQRAARRRLSTGRVPLVDHLARLDDKGVRCGGPFVDGVQQPVEVCPPRGLVLALVVAHRGRQHGHRLRVGRAPTRLGVTDQPQQPVRQRVRDGGATVRRLIVLDGLDSPQDVADAWRILSGLKVIDPTCGSGAFLFAALKILQNLYATVLDAATAHAQTAKHAGQTRQCSRRRS